MKWATIMLPISFCIIIEEGIMKRIVKYLLALVVCPAILFSQEPMQFRISLIGNDTIFFNKLVYGFHPEATNGLDTSLGELDLPPFIPPSGFRLYGVFIFYDSTQSSNIWSYVDLKPYPNNSTDTIKFLLYAIRESGIKLRIRWQSFPDVVRYAWLVDEYLGTLVQVDMLKTNFVDINNEFLDKFYIKLVLGNINSTNLENGQPFDVSYNEFEKRIYLINRSKEPVDLKFFDILGNLLDELELVGNSSISLDKLPKGIYFVEIKQSNKLEVKKVVIY